MRLLSQKCQKWQNIVFEQKSNCPQVTSGSQFFFWVASCLCQGLKLASEILGPHTEGGNGSKFCIDHQQKGTRPRISIIVQGPNGALCLPPSPSASPLSFFSSHFLRTTRPSMQISQVCVLRLVRQKHMCYNCPGHNPDNPSPKHTASTPSRLWFGW